MAIIYLSRVLVLLIVVLLDRFIGNISKYRRNVFIEDMVLCSVKEYIETVF